MAFDTFDPRMKEIAERTLTYCRQQFGSNGLRVEEGISPLIAWRPTIQVRPSSALIVAVEVVDNLYPSALKIAAHDIGFYDTPVAVYQACSLDAYQNDPKHANVNLLKQHGFGLITVDQDGLTSIQHPAVALRQHITEATIEEELAPLTPKLKVGFRGAHKTYGTNIGQGLQQAGQIVEAMIIAMASQAAKKGHISKADSKGPAADVIDHLYQSADLKAHRAALGGARAFVKGFRNAASHPSKTARQAAEKMKVCREGFLEALATVKALQTAAQAQDYRLSLHLI